MARKANRRFRIVLSFLTLVLATVPASASKLDDVLTSFIWKWDDGKEPIEVVFNTNHKFRNPRGNTIFTLVVTGDHTFTLNGGGGGGIADYTINDDFTRFEGQTAKTKVHITGTRLRLIDPSKPAPAGLTPSATVAPAAKTVAPTPRAPSASVPTLAVPMAVTSATSPNGRSQLANFWQQIPVAAAWAHASLEIKTPPNLVESLVTFKRGLAQESTRTTPLLQKAYVRAGILADQLVTTANARSQFLAQATGGREVPPSPQAIAQWAIYATGHRAAFKSPRVILDEAVFAGGGLGKSVPLVDANFPLVRLPTPPASILSPDFDANPAYVRVSADGPSGTNFGVGDRTLKVGGAVVSNSDVPIPVSVTCYWVGWDGKKHLTAEVGHLDEGVCLTHPIKIEYQTIAWRTNGGTQGVLFKSYPIGPYRGWIVTVRGKDGKRIATASNMPEFGRLVP